MEKFFFKKIEVWVVGLLAVFGAGALIAFGAIVRNEALGHDRFGVIGDIAYALASMPKNAEDLWKSGGDNWMAVRQSDRFPEKAGWDLTQSQGRGFAGYLLLSRYDGDVDRHVVELVDLGSFETLYRLVMEPEKYFEDVRFDRSGQLATPWEPARFRAIHPLIFENGDLLIKDHSGPIARVNACGKLVWRQDQLDFHHSLEKDLNGDIWVPVRLPIEDSAAWVTDLDNMGIARLSDDGQIEYTRSTGDLFLKHGLDYLILSVGEHFEPNPMHLNDIQPVPGDGPYWKRGDLFLSFRALSAVVLYRPSTDEIVWMKRGPWIAQHDVDIVNDHMIAVFNNDTVNLGGGPRVRSHNKITLFDFNSGTVTDPFDTVLAEHEIRSDFGGLFSLLPDDATMVEETDGGRLVIFGNNDNRYVEFVNRASDGKLYFMGWSRYIDAAEGAELVKRLAVKQCDE